MLFGFKEFAISPETGLYVCLKYDINDCQAIHKWFLEYHRGARRPATPNLYHTTIASSMSPKLKGEFEPLGKVNVVIPFEKVRLGHLGRSSGMNTTRVLSLLFESPWINERREQIKSFLSSLGIRDKRRPEKTHIGLDYNSPGYINNEAMKAFPLKSITIVEEAASTNDVLSFRKKVQNG